MELLQSFIDVFLHLDAHLSEIIGQYGLWTYVILFLVVFCETGLVVAPFLPGDSLLFAAGAFAATGALDFLPLFILLTIAAIVGDSVNYAIGRSLGPKVFRKDGRFLHHEHLERTRRFYDVHGAKTIVLARFLPIIRTFAPFVAGVGNMKYETFVFYNIAGGVAWVFLFLAAGYGFGNIPFVRDHFSVVIMGIIVVSLIPMVVEYLRKRRR